MSNSLNKTDSQGYESPTLRWVDTQSDDGYQPTDCKSGSTTSQKYSVKYSVNAGAGQYQTALVSTPETRKRERLKRLNRKFRTLSNAY